MDLPDTLIYSFVGYNSKKIVIDERRDKKLNVKLIPMTFNLEGVMVESEQVKMDLTFNVGHTSPIQSLITIEKDRQKLICTAGSDGTIKIRNTEGFLLHDIKLAKPGKKITLLPFNDKFIGINDRNLSIFSAEGTVLKNQDYYHEISRAEVVEDLLFIIAGPELGVYRVMEDFRMIKLHTFAVEKNYPALFFIYPA